MTLSLYQILCLIGVPSLTSIVAWIYNRQKKIEEIRKTDEEKQKVEIGALKLGVQALLRSQMINDYNRWNDKGYAPIYARENFENCWIQYEALGENGVMEDIHNKFMSLPTKRIDR